MNDIYDMFLNSLRRYKRAFTMRCHPNLWQDHQASYMQVEISGFKAYVEGSQADTSRLGILWDCLREYCNLWNIGPICFENRYYPKTVLDTSPRDDFRHSGHGQYEDFTKNIKRHLDRKEDFLYQWESRYSVSIYGTLGKDGVYRAHMSLAKRVVTQVEMYYLINEKSAIFMEED